MHCANCGNLLPPQAKVCPNCGTRVPGNIPASSPNILPSEQASYENFGSFEESGPTGANSPQEKTVRQTPPIMPQEPYFGAYSMPNQPTPQEQFQFPAPPSSPFSPSSPTEQFPQTSSSVQPPQPQMSFGNAMQPPPQQPFNGTPPQHFADTTQQDIPVHNPPSYAAMPLQSSPSSGQYMQFGSPGQPGQPGQPGPQWQQAQPAYPLQPVQPAQPTPRRLSTGLIIALIVAIVLIIAGSSLVYYVGVARPAQLHAQATATVVTQLQGTAVANTHATGTAQAQANATTTAVAVATAQVQATMTAYVNMYTQVASGTPAMNDQLTGNDANNWDTYSNNGSGCGFSSGRLHATGDGGICVAQATNFGDFAYQAKVNIVKGSTTTAGGLMFRLDRSTLKFYAFGIDTNGGYFLALFQVGSSKTTYKNLTNGINQAITPGFNVTNTLAILARGSTFYLYVNNQYITQFNDTNSAAGAIGVFGSDSASGVDVSFTNAEVWRA